MLKSLSTSLLVLTLLGSIPALGQERAVPLLRVYLYAPYFYDILADVELPNADTGTPLHVYVEGKEVGASDVIFDCVEGTWTETVTTPWTGASAAFLDAALMSFDQRYCGL